jgi:hypothetical protein
MKPSNGRPERKFTIDIGYLSRNISIILHSASACKAGQLAYMEHATRK